MISDVYFKGDGKVKWVSTSWLEENIDKNMIIIDFQPNIHDYIKEHIPNAYYFNEGLFRNMHNNNPADYIPPSSIQTLFRNYGFKKSIPILVYTGKGVYSKNGDGWGQTMAAYTLLRFGHPDVYILNGGIDKWKEEGKNLTKIFPKTENSNFKVNVQSDYYIEYEEFKAIKDDENVIVLDARPPKYYKGHSLWNKPGHIPGAKNLQAASLMQPHNLQLMKEKEEIKSIADELEATEDKKIICYCGTGREATNLFIVFKWFLGYKKVRLYEGSFTEWTQRDNNPTVTGPNPY